jgi:hypothetical protein
MKSTMVTASEFKTKCLHLLEGENLMITKRRRKVAKVSPISPPKRFLLGNWKGLVKITGDIVQC